MQPARVHLCRRNILAEETKKASHPSNWPWKHFNIIGSEAQRHLNVKGPETQISEVADQDVPESDVTDNTESDIGSTEFA